MLGGLNQSEAPSQMLLRIVNKKPGLKDTNFQVAKLRLDSVKTIAETFPVSVYVPLKLILYIKQKSTIVFIKHCIGDDELLFMLFYFFI